MSFIYLITKGFEDSFTCGCDTTDSVRYHLRANKIDLSLKYIAIFDIFSPTHKRTEERAPVWGSEFTSKRRRTTGGIQQKPL